MLIGVKSHKGSVNMQKKGSSPTYKEKAGSLSIAVFENEGKTKDGREFVFKTVNLQKGYKDKAGEWQNVSISLRSDDIPKAIMLLEMAYKDCVLKEKIEQE